MDNANVAFEIAVRLELLVADRAGIVVGVAVRQQMLLQGELPLEGHPAKFARIADVE